MAKSREQLEAEETVDLKDPALAAFLAWLIPGLGHFYQGRVAKAILFFVCIMGTFLYGLYLGQGRVVYFSWRQGDKRLYYICQVCTGLVALPALVQANRAANHKKPLFDGFIDGFMAQPPLIGKTDAQGREVDPDFDDLGQPTLNKITRDLSRYFELGSLYTAIAGLLNVLAIYDAWGGPVFHAPKKKDEEEE